MHSDIHIETLSKKYIHIEQQSMQSLQMETLTTGGKQYLI
jgi:hypothetical protein